MLGVLTLGLMAFTLPNSVLQIGDTAPMQDHKVTDTSGRSLSFSEVAGSNGLLVMFTCNTCPWVSKWEDRFNTMADQAETNGIGMIALNPNERIRSKGESMEDMKRRAQKQNYRFPYALDKDHELADAFGATRTPEIFLFDKDMKLVYHGAIDDNANDAADVEQAYVRDAISQLSAGISIQTSETRSLGCTIKRTE